MIIDEENNSVFFIEKLNNLKKELDNDTLDLERIRKDIKQLNEFKEYQNYDYLNDLLDPIRRKGVKIPSSKPIPSCSFQLHNYITFRTNSKGNDVFCFNPFFLASDKLINKEVYFGGIKEYLTIGAGMYFFANSNDPYTGTAPYTDWYFPEIPCQMISDVYSKYRVVSACVTLRYLGELDAAQGTIGGGIAFINNPYVGVRLKQTIDGDSGHGSRANGLSQFGNFDLIRDCVYSQENTCLEGLKMLYFPLDNSFEEFKDVWDGTILKTNIFQTTIGAAYGVTISEKYYKSGFNWFMYIQNGPYNPPNRNFRLDFYINYECLPRPELLNYIPVSLNVYPLSKQLLSQVIEEIQDKAIQKLNNE